MPPLVHGAPAIGCQGRAAGSGWPGSRIQLMRWSGPSSTCKHAQSWSPLGNRARPLPSTAFRTWTTTRRSRWPQSLSREIIKKTREKEGFIFANATQRCEGWDRIAACGVVGVVRTHTCWYLGTVHTCTGSRKYRGSCDNARESSPKMEIGIFPFLQMHLPGYDPLWLCAR